VGWLDGGAERKAGQLLLPVNDGTQNVITVPAFGGGKPNLDGVLYPDATYQSSASAGFGRNELVYACIRERAENLPQSVLRVYPGDQPAAHGESLENHRLRRLISQPNPVTGEFEFFELSVTYLDLAGNCYWLIQRGRDGLPAELWPVRPDLIRIFPTLDPRVWSYGYILDPTTSARNVTSAIIPITSRDMIHVKYANPLSAYFGQAPLRPAARAVSLDNAATDFVDTLLRNYAVPGVVIKTSSEVTQAVADKLKRKWKASFAGARRGEPAVLQAGMDVQPLGMSLRDLEFPDLRAFSESRICAALQVPPILVGAKVGLDRSTFCLPYSSRVWTARGPVPIGEIREGDAVWSHAGGGLALRPVTHHAVAGHGAVYRIQTKNRVLRASGNHPLLVRVPGRRGGGPNATRHARTAWRRADEIRPGDRVVQAQSLPDLGGIVAPGGLLATADLLQWCGAYFGDGCGVGHAASRIAIAMPPADRCRDHYEKLTARLFAPSTMQQGERYFGFTSAKAKRFLRTLGLSGTAGTKRVPGWMYGLARPLRLAFLAGITDSDGHIDRRGSLTVCLANRELVEDIKMLLVSCGIQASNLGKVTIPASSLPNPGLRDSYEAWRITASSAAEVAEIPFADWLYRERVAANAGRRRRGGMDAGHAGLDDCLGFYTVRSVSTEPAEDVFDIEVEDGHTFVAEGIVVHNTNYAEARKQLWEEAIFSLQRRFRDPVETQLLPEFSGTGRARVTTRWDNSQVLALQEAESAKWERGVNALAHAGITVNDFRRLVGLETDPAGDVFLLPRGAVPLPAGAVPAPGDVVGLQPPGEQPGQVPPGDAPGMLKPAPPLPQIRVASYADEFLASLVREPPRVNGHGRR